MKNPCKGCKLVCNNRGCVLWKDWFLKRWEQIYLYGKIEIPKFLKSQEKNNGNK